MSLTLNSTPANIDKAAAFDVTTSLVEDSTHVNLRVRADIYHEGIIKATVEKPKGLSAFDFAEILKALTPGLLFARDSGDIAKTGTVGSNLCTLIADKSTNWDTLTISTNALSAAVHAHAVSTWARIASITVVVGELYMLYSPDYATTGVNAPVLYMDKATSSQAAPIAINKGIIFMPTSAGTAEILIGNTLGELNFSGTFYLYKITTSRTTIGNPLAPYFAIFTEVYENASGVTATGATSATLIYRYVPAVGDANAFTEYVLHDNTCLFACKTFKGNVAKVYTVTPYEYWVVFFSEFADMELFYSKDGAGAVHTTHPVCYEGWGVIILNVGELLATVTATLAIYLKETSGAGTVISETLTANVDASQIDERVVLEFDGLVGGKEYLAFEGAKDIRFATIRNYYRSSKQASKPLSFTGINKQKLATRFKDIGNTEYLKSLMVSETVKKLESSYAAPTVVTITSENVQISSSELFNNTLDIEYEY